jgi:hypothetical protein
MSECNKAAEGYISRAGKEWKGNPGRNPCTNSGGTPRTNVKGKEINQRSKKL